MAKIKVKVTAKVTKIIEVDIDTKGLSEEDIENAALEEANQQFDVECDGTEESYSQDAEVI